MGQPAASPAGIEICGRPAWPARQVLCKVSVRNSAKEAPSGMLRSGGSVGVVGSTITVPGWSNAAHALGDFGADLARRLDLGKADLGRHLEALLDARSEVDIMGLNKGKQRRLDLEALDDAEGIAPAVGILAGEDFPLGLR